MRFWDASALVPLLVPEGKTETVARLLRSGDAIQLASAAVAAEGADVPLEFVCFDRRLALVAITEGLRVVPDAGG